jgi:hypothetical protein
MFKILFDLKPNKKPSFFKLKNQKCEKFATSTNLELQNDQDN